jgi:ABC-type transport system involved in cytochrome c biogenesis permease subunit
MNSDPWGIPVTYLGYALLFISLIWMLFDPKGTYRRLLRSPLLKRGMMLLALFHLTSSISPLHAAPRVLPKETAEKFGQLFMVYNDRVCPVQTYAIDFTKKLYGKRSYGEYSAEQVLTGFVFFHDDWVEEPVIKVKGGELKGRLGIPDYASMNYFFGKNGYILGPYVQEFYQGQQQESFHKQVSKMDEKLMLIMDLHKGTPLKLLPYQDKGTITWYAPTDNLPEQMDEEHRKYIRDVFTLLNGEIQAGNYQRANAFLDKMLVYQKTFGASSLPTDTQVKAERIYNKVAFATILFMACLTMGILSFLLLIFNKMRPTFWWQRGFLLLAFLALSFGLALRWIITGTIPMSNGYETMLFLAWSIMLLSLIVCSWFPIMLTFGFLLSGFLLLVSHISQMDPQMTPLMPVLNSPLLTIHVSVIMMAYALLSLTFVSSLTALLVHSKAEEMTLLSQLMLYPALTFLGFGIFIGAIWANLSWGTYWSWDPKETWALITFMIYAAPAHNSFHPQRHESHSREGIGVGSSPLFYHLYMTFAFLSILMTYFGVNYILGGMHSYA